MEAPLRVPFLLCRYCHDCCISTAYSNARSALCCSWPLQVVLCWINEAAGIEALWLMAIFSISQDIGAEWFIGLVVILRQQSRLRWRVSVCDGPVVDCVAVLITSNEEHFGLFLHCLFESSIA